MPTPLPLLQELGALPLPLCLFIWIEGIKGKLYYLRLLRNVGLYAYVVKE